VIESQHEIAYLRAGSVRARYLDQIAWRAGIVGSRYGVRLAIRTNDAAALVWARGALPTGWRRSRPVAVDRLYSLVKDDGAPTDEMARYDLYAGTRRLAGAATRDVTFRVLENDAHLHLAEHAPAHVFLHAGVVGWHGRAIVFPGRSLAGKSTLVAALLRAGASYYSDEFAVIDARGRVHPFPRPLSIRMPALGTSRRVSHRAFGAARGVQPLPVGAIVVTRYRAGGRWRPRRLSPAEAIVALLSHAICARRRPRATLDTLTHAVRHAEAVRGTRGEVEAVIAYLTALGSGWHDHATYPRVNDVDVDS
jgi:hypothetical protein